VLVLDISSIQREGARVESVFMENPIQGDHGLELAALTCPSCKRLIDAATSRICVGCGLDFADYVGTLTAGLVRDVEEVRIDLPPDVDAQTREVFEKAKPLLVEPCPACGQRAWRVEGVSTARRSSQRKRSVGLRVLMKLAGSRSSAPPRLVCGKCGHTTALDG
jgi:predicted RNA-binding Zn-ribbon protein involved in translation (DUF1610 family)